MQFVTRPDDFPQEVVFRRHVARILDNAQVRMGNRGLERESGTGWRTLIETSLQDGDRNERESRP